MDSPILTNFLQNFPLKNLTTFGIGGEAKFFIEISQIQEMCETLQFCNKNHLPFIVIGKGSNLLFDDQGFNGLVIGNRINFFHKPQENVWHVGAGYSFSLLGSQTARQGWSGLEFASGIPGSVGGAVFMNAGANGHETCDHLQSVDYVFSSGECQQLAKEELNFSYRSSSFQSLSGAIVGATFKLTPSSSARAEQINLVHYRKNTQPYSDKSAGCVFRNPLPLSAGALIEKIGLKGKKIGGAQISTLHANFVVNTGTATSQDVLDLLKFVQEKIKEETGIELESEVRYIPFQEIDKL